MVTTRNPYLFTNVDEIGPVFGLNEIKNFVKSFAEPAVPLIYELYVTYTQRHARHQTQYPRGVAFTLIEFIQKLNVYHSKAVRRHYRTNVMEKETHREKRHNKTDTVNESSLKHFNSNSHLELNLNFISWVEAVSIVIFSSQSASHTHHELEFILLVFCSLSLATILTV